MARIRCAKCNGAGKAMGGGMLMKDCEQCKGKGSYEPFDIEAAKKTKPYKSARKRLISLCPNKTESEIDMMLEAEFKEMDDLHV